MDLSQKTQIRLLRRVPLARPEAIHYGRILVTNLSSSNNWITVPGTPEVVGDQFQVTNGPVNRNSFFRLRTP